MLNTKKLIAVSIICSNYICCILAADTKPKWSSIAKNATAKTQIFPTEESLKKTARGAYESTGKLSSELVYAIRNHTKQLAMSEEQAIAWMLNSEPTLSPIFKPEIIIFKETFSPQVEAEEPDYTNPELK